MLNYWRIFTSFVVFKSCKPLTLAYLYCFWGWRHYDDGVSATHFFKLFKI